MEWDPAHHCRPQRSLDLRLLPHIIGRGEHFLHSASGLYLIHQGQIEYIWSRKASLGVSFPTTSSDLRATALTDHQFLCYSSWCGHLYFVTEILVLQAIKNRYWPVWLLLWTFIGEYIPQSARRSLQPWLNLQIALLSPLHTRQVRNASCSRSECCSRPSLDVRFAMRSSLNRTDNLPANLTPGVTRHYGLVCFTTPLLHCSPSQQSR